MIREEHLENRPDLDMVIVDLEKPRTEWKETLRDGRREVRKLESNSH